MNHHVISFLIGIIFWDCCFAQIPRKLPDVSEDATAYVYPAKSFWDIREKMMLEPSTQILTSDELGLVRSLLNATTAMSRERFKTSLDDGFFVEIRNGSNKPFGCFFNREGYTSVPNDGFGFRTYRYPKKQKEAFLALVEKYQPHSESQQRYIRLDSFTINYSSVHFGTHCLFSGFHSHLYIDFIVCKDSLHVFPVCYHIGYKQKKMVPTYITRDYYLWSEKPLSKIDQDGTIFFFNTQGKECSAKSCGISSDEANNTLQALFPFWPQMTDQQRMRMLDDFIINQLSKPDRSK